MSYDIYLKDKDTKQTIMLDENHNMTGGTFAIGGTPEAWLNITYNYGKHYYRIMGDEGIRSIYGLTGEESIPVLEAAIAQLGDDTDNDYWKATEGNARLALMDLVELAKLAPQGIWAGD